MRKPSILRRPVLVAQIALLSLGLCSHAAFSHSRMLSPAGRTSTDPGTQSILDNAGLNFDDPCGPPTEIPPGPPTATWAAGSDQLVEIDHRVNHGGETYQLFISFDGGQTFAEALPPNQSQAGAIDYQTGGIPTSGDSFPRFLIGLPATSGAAVLRYTDGTYFNCADITLTDGGVEIFGDGFELGDLSAWSE